MATRFDVSENARSAQIDAEGPAPAFMAGTRIFMPGEGGNAVVDTEWNVDSWPPVIDTARPVVPEARVDAPTPIWQRPTQIQTAPIVPLVMQDASSGEPLQGLGGTVAYAVPNASGTRIQVTGDLPGMGPATMRAASRRNRIQAIRDVWWTRGALADPGDPRLVAALYRFQRALHLPGTGVADTTTMKRLRVHVVAGTNIGREFGPQIRFTDQRRHNFFSADVPLRGRVADNAARFGLSGDPSVPAGWRVGADVEWRYPAVLPRWLFPNVTVGIAGSYDSHGRRQSTPLNVPIAGGRQSNKLSDVLARLDQLRQPAAGSPNQVGTPAYNQKNALAALHTQLGRGLVLSGEGADEAAEMLRMLPTTSNEPSRITAPTTREQIDAVEFERAEAAQLARDQATAQAASQATAARRAASQATAARQAQANPSTPAATASSSGRNVWGRLMGQTASVTPAPTAQTPAPTAQTPARSAQTAAWSAFNVLVGGLRSRVSAGKDATASMAQDTTQSDAARTEAAIAEQRLAAAEARIDELLALVASGQLSADQAAQGAGAALKDLPPEVAADVVEAATVEADADLVEQAPPDQMDDLRRRLAETADLLARQAVQATQGSPNWVLPALGAGTVLAVLLVATRKR